MSSDLLRLEELGLRLEELKKEIESDTKENKNIEDEKRNINFQIASIDSELEELYSQKNLKKNSASLKNKHFFKLAKISMAIVFSISLLTDFIETISIGQTFPSYFNFTVFFCSIGIMLPFHAMYTRKISKQCKGINLEELNKLINSKSLQMGSLKKELIETKNNSIASFEKLRKKQEEMSFVRSEMKNIEHQINTNTKKDRRPASKVKQLSLQEKIN